MGNFEFIIDEKANFARFIEIIGEEDRHGGKIMADYFLKQIGPLSPTEESAISQAKIYFQKKRRNGTIWRKFLNIPVKDEEDLALWSSAENGLKKKFNTLFQNEIPKLELWRQKLSEYIETEQSKKIVTLVNSFFGYNNKEKIIVLLQISDNTNIFRARTFPTEKNILLLEVSNESLDYIQKSFLVLMHEYSHNIMNSSKEILKRIDIEADKIKTYNFPIPKDWTEKSILEESLVVAVAGPRLTSALGYYIYGEDSKEVEMDVITQEEFERGRAMRFIIRIVAMRVSKFTYDYIKTGKRLDDIFYKKLTNTWIQTLQEIDKIDKKIAA